MITSGCQTSRDVDAFLTVRRGAHLEALELEIDHEQVAHGVRVVDDENAGAAVGRGAHVVIDPALLLYAFGAS